MAVILAPNRLGDGRIHRMHQIKGGFHGFLPAVLADHLRNPCRPLFLAIVPDDAAQFPLAQGVEQLCRRFALGGVHSHVQRRVLMIGKAALPPVQLRGGNAQVQQHAVQQWGAHAAKKLLAIVKISMQRMEALISAQPR